MQSIHPYVKNAGKPLPVYASPCLARNSQFLSHVTTQLYVCGSPTLRVFSVFSAYCGCDTCECEPHDPTVLACTESTKHFPCSQFPNDTATKIYMRGASNCKTIFDTAALATPSVLRYVHFDIHCEHQCFNGDLSLIEDVNLINIKREQCVYPSSFSAMSKYFILLFFFVRFLIQNYSPAAVPVAPQLFSN